MVVARCNRCHANVRFAALLLRFVAALAFAGVLGRLALAQPDEWAERRAAMVRTIQEYAASMPEGVAPGGISAAILDVMGKVPRHRFVPGLLERLAYRDGPLPIGLGQTISQPFIVALMTELLEPQPADRVLEVGTGSGYQAAVLAECVAKVYSIEILAPLAERARSALDAAGYRNVETRTGDGYLGWPEAAPFDGIIVTAAPDHVPPALVEQLKPGARMVIPVGPRGLTQELLVIRTEADGRAVTRRTILVRFVPLTRSR